MKKGYMRREGDFGSDWEIIEKIVFPTKMALKNHFKDINGFNCYRSKKTCYGKEEEMLHYGKDEEIYENKNYLYGYEIITVEVRE